MKLKPRPYAKDVTGIFYRPQKLQITTSWKYPHDKKNYSIPECFKPLTISKAIKIISFKKNNIKSKEETEINIDESE